jgi:GNAT superfamily N-acetyltransferase
VPGVDDEVVVALHQEYLQWVFDRLRLDHGIGDYTAVEEETRAMLSQFRPPGGALLLAECAGEVAGVGALRTLSPGVGEVKRMYVRRPWRGHGMGAALFDRLVGVATARGDTVVRLDTAPFMPEAHQLYRSRGFVECPPYPGSEIPEVLWPLYLFFERSLSD